MQTNIKELLDEYAGCHRVVDNCEDDGYGCKMCLEDRERMQEIEKELEASIRKEVRLKTIAEMRAVDLVTSPSLGQLQHWKKDLLDEVKREVENVEPAPSLDIYLDKVKNGNKDDMYDYGVLCERTKISTIIDQLKLK